MELMDGKEDSEDSTSLLEIPDDEADTISLDCTGSDYELSEDTQNVEVVTMDQLMQQMDDIIKGVQGIIRVQSTRIYLLLTRFIWDAERLVEYYSEQDVEQYLLESNLNNPSQTTSDVSSEDSVCDICCLEQRSGGMTGFGCGHYFCHDCWLSYLTYKIVDENPDDQILCPGHMCNFLWDYAEMLKGIQDPIARRRYQHMVTNNSVECNPLLVWCPGAECGCAVRVSWNEACYVVCANCKESFCFSCRQPCHEPARCCQLKNWQLAVTDFFNEKSLTWIAKHTNACPQCGMPIEKNGGDNHIMCMNLDCTYEFCWVCLQQWETHRLGIYNCSRHIDDQCRKDTDAQQASNADHPRLMFYLDRHSYHFELMKMEDKLSDKVRKKMELSGLRMFWFNDKSIRQSLNVLRNCRCTLMYSYVFAYYLQNNNETSIFEGNQKDLEHSTKQLSKYLELEIDNQQTTNQPTDNQQRVNHISSYCDKRRKVLLDHVRDGYDNDTWESRDCSDTQ